MENFSNNVIAPGYLPLIEEQSFNALDKRYLRILLLQKIVFFILLCGGLAAFFLLSGIPVPSFVISVIFMVVLALIVYSSLVTYLGFPKKGYLLRENDISFQKGLLVYKVTSVPFNRIQHVEVSQGILSKAFGISTLKLYTAGGNASDLSIPGLPQETALNLKTFLSDKISQHE